jgi:transposase
MGWFGRPCHLRAAGKQEQGAKPTNRVPKAKSAVVATLGVDVGKKTFHLVGLDKRCTIVLRKGLSRAQTTSVWPTRPAAWWAWRPESEPLTWAAALRPLATAKYVHPFCRKQNAAQAIAKAATGPTVKYVTRKTPAQLDLQALCGVRERLAALTEPRNWRQ